jgi:hypothetical protein
MATKKQLANRKKRKEKIAETAPEPKGLSKQRLWQAKMVAEGRCQRCGDEIAEDSKSSCKKCLKKARERYQRKKKEATK